jgi:hypothetical protein
LFFAGFLGFGLYLPACTLDRDESGAAQPGSSVFDTCQVSLVPGFFVAWVPGSLCLVFEFPRLVFLAEL